MATPFDQLGWNDVPTYNDGTYEGRSVTMCVHCDTVCDSTDPDTISEWTGNQQASEHPAGVLVAIEQNPDTSPDGRTVLHNCGQPGT